jgi:hypothetical protein
MSKNAIIVLIYHRHNVSEIIAVYCVNHTKQKHAAWAKFCLFNSKWSLSLTRYTLHATYIGRGCSKSSRNLHMINVAR